MGFRFYLSYENLILGSVPAFGHRDTEDGDDDDDGDDVGDDADEVTMGRATDRGTEGGDDGVDGDDDVVGDDADEVTMVQNYRQSRTRSTDPVSDLPAHTSCLLVGPPLLF